MHEATLVVVSKKLTQSERYEAIENAAKVLIGTESDAIAAMANLCALLYYSLPDINWCGFYRRRGNELLVGPFQGKPACQRIPIGSGVCGKAASERRIIIVPDVQKFPDHIACDPQSRSELVLPFEHDSELVGVLDLDSPVPERFSYVDAHWLSYIVNETVMKVWK